MVQAPNHHDQPLRHGGCSLLSKRPLQVARVQIVSGSPDKTAPDNRPPDQVSPETGELLRLFSQGEDILEHARSFRRCQPTSAGLRWAAAHCQKPQSLLSR